jgi:Domain of unknown function (DUF4442)
MSDKQTKTISSGFYTFWFRILMNLYPMYFGTGGKILKINPNWQYLKIRLRRNVWTYNVMGSIFGGSMFAATDPFYMLMFIHLLGQKSYVVWDKAAHIKFIAPGRTTLYAEFVVPDEILDQVRTAADQHGFSTIELPVRWCDKHGKVHAEIIRTIYVATRSYYLSRKKTIDRAWLAV